MPEAVRVFVSSTAEDLKPYRDAARDAAIGADMLLTMMEYFVAAGDKPPLDFCLSKVSEADLLVVIVAHRYGWVPPDQSWDAHKSITWLECERAAAEGKEVLAFLLDEKQPWPAESGEAHRLTAAIQNDSATEDLFREVKRNVACLKDFKAWLNSRGIRATFTTPHDLRGRVSDALQDWRRRHSGAGTSGKPPTSRSDPTAYLRDLLTKTSFIDIRGLQVGKGQAHRFPIEDLYISLTTTRAGTGTDDARARRGKRLDSEEEIELGVRESRDVPLHAALQNDRLVVIGDPGAGKTTFLRRIAYSLCQTQLGEQPDAAQVRLGIADRTFPLFIRLSELARPL